MSRDFAAPDPDFAERVRESFARQSLMTMLGARLHAVEPGRVAVAMDASPGVLQQHGFVHGGALASLADTAAGYAAATLMPAGSGVLTVEFKINFLSPARQASVLARGRVIRPGRTITVTETEVVGLEDGREVPVAHLVATMMILAGQPDITG